MRAPDFFTRYAPLQERIPEDLWKGIRANVEEKMRVPELDLAQTFEDRRDQPLIVVDVFYTLKDMRTAPFNFLNLRLAAQRVRTKLIEEADKKKKLILLTRDPTAVRAQYTVMVWPSPDGVPPGDGVWFKVIGQLL